MNELILERSVAYFLSVRNERRAAAFINIIGLLLEDGYANELAGLVGLVNGCASDEIVLVETLVLETARKWFNKYSIALNVARANEIPVQTGRVMNLLFSEIEDYEDFPALHTIVHSDDDLEYVLEQFLGVMDGETPMPFEGLLEPMSQNPLIVIRSYLDTLVANELEEDYDIEAQSRMIRYLQHFPENPSASMFAHDAYKLNLNYIVSQLEWTEELDRTRQCIIYLVGICVFDSETKEQAHEKLETRAVQILQPEDPEDLIISQAFDALADIYITLPVLAQVDDE